VAVALDTFKGPVDPSSNFVGIANDLSISGVVPTFGGIQVTGTAVQNLNPGLLVDIGTNTSGDDFPIVVQGALTISTNGSGAADIELKIGRAHV